MPDLDVLAPLVSSYLERQGWYQAAIAPSPPSPVELVSVVALPSSGPGLARAVLRRGDQRFQLLVGWRAPAEVAGALHGRESSIIGSFDDGDAGSLLAYEATADDQLAIELLAFATDGRERAERVRRVSSLVSHASLVFDERLFMKCYRVLERGPRAEVEVMLRLDGVGFNAMLAPVAHWREGDEDLALVREFLPSALEGRLLALTSLRDLLAHATGDDGRTEDGVATHADDVDVDAECASAGGDFASEISRLGATTARLHLALATAFGDRPVGDFSALASALATDARDGSGLVAEQVARIDPASAGRVIRLHGDYHLRRVMRSETGWLVAGFGDDPVLAEKRATGSQGGRWGSPVEDVADMCLSLRRVAREALAQRPMSETGTAARLAEAWERRNQAALLEGYVTTDGARRLLPSDPRTTEILLTGFESARERLYEATSAEL